jgi:two-component system cell cycle sensor histidine kinase/response regulator CckA
MPLTVNGPRECRMKDKSTKRTRITERFVWIGIGLAALWWVLEACIHVFVFHDRTFIGQLLNPDQHEWWMRSFVAGLLLIFSAYAQSIVNSRRRAQEATKHAHAELDQIFQTAADGMRVVSKDFNVLRVNETFSRMSGISKEEAVDKKCYEVFRGPLCHTPSCPLTRIVGGEQRVECDTEKKRNDGTVVSCIVTATAFRGPGGELIGIVEDFKDITARKQAAEALVRAKLDWENTFDAIADMVMLLDNEHQIIRVNRAAAEALNTTKESLVGKKCYEAVHKRSHPIRECPLVVTMKTLEPQSAEIEEPRLGGTFICSTSPMLDGEGRLTGYTHSLKNITESKQLQFQFQQAQRLESVGTLAGGIAHDFNNLLMGIQGNVSLLLMDINSKHPHYGRLRNIERQVQSGAGLTSHILGYARKGKYEVKPVGLNQLVEETSNTFGRTRKEITIHQELAEDLFAIEGDPGQIEQVLLNLYVNAADAMPGGGKLILKTMNTTHKDMKDKVYDPKPGQYILLTVTDTGTGMDKETMERIFDPFFTTKEMGGGTGLGLASAYGIIKGHGGYIDVDSKRGEGTTFNIYLPASEKTIGNAVEAAEQFIKGTGTVLVVDDEDDVLEIGKDLLEAMGYQVLTARDGKRAIEVYRKYQDDIGFVLLDMIMPDMGGSEVYDKMKAVNSNVKVLLSSGYSINSQATQILERGCDGFIQKPFTMKELSQATTQLLDKE